MNILERGALYVRVDGVTGSGIAGRYDATGLTYPIAPEDAFIRWGSMYVTEGTHQSAEDGAWDDIIDKVRHEAAHALIAWEDDPTANTVIMDLGYGTSQTAQQISSTCRVGQ